MVEGICECGRKGELEVVQLSMRTYLMCKECVKKGEEEGF